MTSFLCSYLMRHRDVYVHLWFDWPEYISLDAEGSSRPVFTVNRSTSFFKTRKITLQQNKTLPWYLYVHWHTAVTTMDVNNSNNTGGMERRKLCFPVIP